MNDSKIRISVIKDDLLKTSWLVCENRANRFFYCFCKVKYVRLLFYLSLNLFSILYRGLRRNFLFSPVFPTWIVNHVHKDCRPEFLIRANVKVEPIKTSRESMNCIRSTFGKKICLFFFYFNLFLSEACQFDLSPRQLLIFTLSLYSVSLGDLIRFVS